MDDDISDVLSREERGTRVYFRLFVYHLLMIEEPLSVMKNLNSFSPINCSCCKYSHLTLLCFFLKVKPDIYTFYNQNL